MGSSAVKGARAVCLLLEDRQYTWLKGVAKELHVTMSDLLRRILDERAASGTRALPQTSRTADIKIDPRRTYLSIIREVPKGPRSSRVFLCACKRCGGTKEIPLTTILRYESRSCGCLGSDNLVKYRHGTHGLSSHRLYDIWYSMCERCSNANHVSFANYGGRGISVDERWWNVSKFIADMGRTYSPGMSLDRIDVNGNYSVDNCRWSTAKEQQRNRRDNTILTAFGETKNLYDWVTDPRCKVGLSCLRQRVERSGWPAERALITTNLRPYRRLKEST